MKNSKLLWLLSILLMAFNIIMYLYQFGGDTVLLYVSDLLPIVCSFIAAYGIFQAFRSFKEFDYTKKVWMMILVGIFFFWIAESLYAILEIGFSVDMNNTFPTIADYFWCIGYFPFFIGLTMMLYQYIKSGFPMGNIKTYGFIAAFILIITVLIIIYILIPIIQDEETTSLASFFYLFYPIADVFLVIPVIIIMYITSLFGSNSISKPWKYMAIGFISFTIADIIYSFLSWQDIYSSGNFTDVAWHAGYLLIGLAGVYQKELVESFKIEE